MLNQEDADRAAIRLAAERVVTRRGTALATVYGRAFYQGEALAWFETVAREQEHYLRRVDAATRQALGCRWA